MLDVIRDICVILTAVSFCLSFCRDCSARSPSTVCFCWFNSLFDSSISVLKSSIPELSLATSVSVICFWSDATIWLCSACFDAILFNSTVCFCREEDWISFTEHVKSFIKLMSSVSAIFFFRPSTVSFTVLCCSSSRSKEALSPEWEFI